MATTSIPRKEWSAFCDYVSRCRFDWETRVEVMNDSFGDQILSKGLPLSGITYEDREGHEMIEIILGKELDHHQSHQITHPTGVSYMSQDGKYGSVVEFRQEDGTETLLHITEPRPLGWDFV